MIRRLSDLIAFFQHLWFSVGYRIRCRVWGSGTVCFGVVSVNEHNLIPFDARSEGEVRELAAKGGKASGASRRRKRDMKAKMKLILGLPIRDAQDEQLVQALGVECGELDNETLMLAALFLRAKEGDVKAVREVRSILGKDTASAELALRREELRLRKQQMQNAAPGEQELPALWAALAAEEEA